MLNILLLPVSSSLQSVPPNPEQPTPDGKGTPDDLYPSMRLSAAPSGVPASSAPLPLVSIEAGAGTDFYLICRCSIGGTGRLSKGPGGETAKPRKHTAEREPEAVAIVFRGGGLLVNGGATPRCRVPGAGALRHQGVRRPGQAARRRGRSVKREVAREAGAASFARQSQCDATGASVAAPRSVRPVSRRRRTAAGYWRSPARCCLRRPVHRRGCTGFGRARPWGCWNGWRVLRPWRGRDPSASGAP